MEEGSCRSSTSVSLALRPTTCLLACVCLHHSFLWFMLLALDLSPYIGIVTCLFGSVPFSWEQRQRSNGGLRSCDSLSLHGR